MKKGMVRLIGAIAATMSIGAQAQGGEVASFKQALTDAEIKLNLRLRYEDVGWDGLEDSDALTLRTRLSFTSADYHGFGLVLEVDDVTALTSVDYRTASNDLDHVGTAIIADPEGTEINQSYLSYKNLGTSFKYGRQRILLDNQRFVGGVGWRQNEQTYDAFSVANSSLEDVTLFYAYLYNVNRIFGEANVIGDHKQQSHLVNAKFSGWSAGSLSAYGYLLDNQTAVALSSDTYGVRWVGSVGESIAYRLEYARQLDAADNPVSYAADYSLLEVDVALASINFLAGYERLGSDDGMAAFSTPLATLHKFQGWTDRFLATPDSGVKDFYMGASGTLAEAKLALHYHNLLSDYGSAKYGRELNVSVEKQFGPLALLLKYADYRADDYGSNTQKIWLMMSATF